MEVRPGGVAAGEVEEGPGQALGITTLGLATVQVAVGAGLVVELGGTGEAMGEVATLLNRHTGE